MSCTTSSATQSSMPSTSPRPNAAQKRNTNAQVRSAARAPSMIMNTAPFGRRSVLPASPRKLPLQQADTDSARHQYRQQRNQRDQVQLDHEENTDLAPLRAFGTKRRIRCR